MSVATALLTGNDPLPQLAEQAVAQALAKAGLSQANGVLLYLSEHFSRDPQPALTACAKAGRCLQVAGALASGLFTENGWTLDRPAAAVMVLGGDLSLGPATPDHTPLLSFSASNGLSGATLAHPRCGFLQTSHGHWQHGRLNTSPHSEIQILGATPQFALSSGWRPISPAQTIAQCQGLELLEINHQRAADNLQRHLPPECRELSPSLLHQIAALQLDEGADADNALANGHFSVLPLLASSPSGHLTLGSRLSPGSRLIWALRQPFAAEGDMRDSLTRLKATAPSPRFGLMASCIGRGPGFYGAEDRDLLAWQESFPGLPLLGAYGNGQLWPLHSGSRIFHNAVVTTLFQ